MGMNGGISRAGHNLGKLATLRAAKIIEPNFERFWQSQISAVGNFLAWQEMEISLAFQNLGHYGNLWARNDRLVGGNTD